MAGRCQHAKGQVNAKDAAGKAAPGGLPPRAGYYMGYLMASELGRDHPLSWVAQLPPDQVKQRARAFLEAQARMR